MLNLMMTNLSRGVTSYIPDVDLRRPAAADPARFARAIDRWEIESLLASPALLEHLADHCLTAGRTLNALRAVFTGGAPVFLRVLEKSTETCPRARVAALYGSTEVEPIALQSYDEITPADRAALAEGAGLPAGSPVLELRLRIIEDHWERHWRTVPMSGSTACPCPRGQGRGRGARPPCLPGLRAQ